MTPSDDRTFTATELDAMRKKLLAHRAALRSRIVGLAMSLPDMKSGWITSEFQRLIDLRDSASRLVATNAAILELQQASKLAEFAGESASFDPNKFNTGLMESQ